MELRQPDHVAALEGLTADVGGAATALTTTTVGDTGAAGAKLVAPVAQASRGCASSGQQCLTPARGRFTPLPIVVRMLAFVADPEPDATRRG